MSPGKLQTDRIAWGRILALLTSGTAGAFAVMVASVSAERLTVEQEDSGATLSILGTSPSEEELGGDDPGTLGFRLGLGATRDAVRASGLDCSVNENYYGSENGLICVADGSIYWTSRSTLALSVGAPSTGYGTSLSLSTNSLSSSHSSEWESRAGWLPVADSFGPDVPLNTGLPDEYSGADVRFEAASRPRVAVTEAGGTFIASASARTIKTFLKTEDGGSKVYLSTCSFSSASDLEWSCSARWVWKDSGVWKTDLRCDTKASRCIDFGSVAEPAFDDWALIGLEVSGVTGDYELWGTTSVAR